MIYANSHEVQYSYRPEPDITCIKATIWHSWSRKQISTLVFERFLCVICLVISVRSRVMMNQAVQTYWTQTFSELTIVHILCYRNLYALNSDWRRTYHYKDVYETLYLCWLTCLHIPDVRSVLFSSIQLLPSSMSIIIGWPILQLKYD